MRDDEIDADALEAALEGFSTGEEQQKTAYNTEEERVRVGFEDIIAFYEEKGHLPVNNETHPIDERLQAVRLAVLRVSDQWRTFLEKESADLYGLLRADGAIKPPPPKKPPPFGNNVTQGHGEEQGKGYVKGQGALCF